MKLREVLGRPQRAAPMQARRHERVQHESPVVVSWDAVEIGREEKGRTLNISEGGARIKLDTVVPLSTVVHIRLPDLKAEATGSVRYFDQGVIGIEFSDVIWHGPRSRPRNSRPPRDPDAYLLPTLGLVLLVVIAYSIPGLLPDWMPYANRQSPPVSKPPAFFTLGSTKHRVYSLQGPPTRMTDTNWYYGPSRVSFRGEYVTGWANSPERPLQVGAPRPSSTTGPPRRISVGSTASEVLEAQGPPVELTDNVWRYGKSEIYFKDGKVVGWKTMEEDPLNVAPEAVGLPGRL